MDVDVFMVLDMHEFGQLVQIIRRFPFSLYVFHYKSYTSMCMIVWHVWWKHALYKVLVYYIYSSPVYLL